MAAAAGMGDGSCGTGTSWMCIGGICWNPAVTFCCRKIIKNGVQKEHFLHSILFSDKNCLLCVHLRNVIDQLFGIFPSETRIGNGFSVNMISDRLISLFDVTFNHQTLYQRTDIGRKLAVMHHFFAIRICSLNFFPELEWLVSMMAAGWMTSIFRTSHEDGSDLHSDNSGWYCRAC